ncbi:hypothetical protein HYT05_02915 [Candidatus Kaiserbacteria bacterium]|nr:hypothetical protein [Candidatus Kaiserbacteria bacterium]
MRDPPPIPPEKRLDAISDTKKSRHHRRPRRHKGPTEPHNITTLTMREHHAWHHLFGHLYATNIARQINAWHPFHGIRVACRQIDMPRYPDLSEQVRGEKISKVPTTLQEESWQYLFGKLDPPQIVHEINTKYLDPDYPFTLKSR